HAGLLGRLSATVKFFGSLLPDVGRLAEILWNPRADNVLQADGLGGLDDGGKLFVEFVVLDVGRDWRETVLFTRCADLRAGVVEVAGKLHFLVADLRNLGKGAIEVGLH